MIQKCHFTKIKQPNPNPPKTPTPLTQALFNTALENNCNKPVFNKIKCPSTSKIKRKVDYYHKNQIDWPANATSNDYLNFSKLELDLNKICISNSYSDIFDIKKSNDRYDYTDTPINTSYSENHLYNKNEQHNKSQSTICNYYHPSEQNTEEKHPHDIENNNNQLRIKLDKLYIKNNIRTKEKKTKIKVYKNKNLSKPKSFSNVNNPNVAMLNILMKNYLNNTNNKNKNMILYKQYKFQYTTDIKSKGTFTKYKTPSMDIMKNSSILQQGTIKNNNTLNLNLNNSKTKIIKHQIKRPCQQKPIALCFDQVKYETYFATPISKKIKDDSIKSKGTSSIMNKANSFGCKRNSSNKSPNHSSYSSSKINKNQQTENHLKISKKLIDQNKMGLMQDTPKATKTSFIPSFTSLIKNNYINNKDNRYPCSAKGSKINLNNQIKVNKGENAKTQSALKIRTMNFTLQNNGKYNNDNSNNSNSNNKKEVKKKLLDRMNKGTKLHLCYLIKNKEEDREKYNCFIYSPNKDNNNSNYYNNSIQKLID